MRRLHRPDLKGVSSLRDRCIVSGSIANNAAADAVRRLRRCHGRRLSAARTICSPVRIPAASAPRRSNTLVESAKLNGVDPEAYLRDILGRIADHPIKRIGDLLPWNVAKHPAARAA